VALHQQGGQFTIPLSQRFKNTLVFFQRLTGSSRPMRGLEPKHPHTLVQLIAQQVD
jgi:hypothetical protein